MCECDRVGRPVGHWGPCSRVPKDPIIERDNARLRKANAKATREMKGRHILRYDPDPDLGEDRDMFDLARGEDW